MDWSVFHVKVTKLLLKDPILASGLVLFLLGVRTPGFFKERFLLCFFFINGFGFDTEPNLGVRTWGCLQVRTERRRQLWL